MTARVSLTTRLALSKVALYLPGATLNLEELLPILDAGVDLLIIGGSNDVDSDVEALREVRRRGRDSLLVATTNGKAAAPANADVVHLCRPGWRFWGYPRGHEWSLLGRDASERGIVTSPGDAFDYLCVGPVNSPADDLVAAAVEYQPPMSVGALPWFAMGDFNDGAIQDYVATGVRRFGFTEKLLELEDPANRVRDVAEVLRGVWVGDDRYQTYRFAAFRR